MIITIIDEHNEETSYEFTHISIEGHYIRCGDKQNDEHGMLFMYLGLRQSTGTCWRGYLDNNQFIEIKSFSIRHA